MLFFLPHSLQVFVTGTISLNVFTAIMCGILSHLCVDSPNLLIRFTLKIKTIFSCVESDPPLLWLTFWLYSVIGQENSRHPFNQSVAN